MESNKFKLYDLASKARRAYEDVINSEVEAVRAKHAARLRELREAEAKADNAWRDEERLEAIRLAEKECSFPEGTRLVEWNNTTGQRWFAQECTPYKTGRTAILRIVRHAKEFAGGYHVEQPGRFVAVLTKKDGSVGKKAERFEINTWAGPRWIPEDHDWRSFNAFAKALEKKRNAETEKQLSL